MKLIDYIRGDRTGRNARRIEIESMRDPLLQDAIDGFDAVPGDHEEAIRRLQQRITAKSAVRPQRKISGWIAAAAVALLCVATGGLYMLSRERDETAGTVVAVAFSEEAEDAGNSADGAAVMSRSAKAVLPAVEVAEMVERAHDMDTVTAEELNMVFDMSETTALADMEEIMEAAVVSEMGVASQEAGVMREQAATAKMRQRQKADAPERQLMQMQTSATARESAPGQDVAGIRELPSALLDSLTAMRGFEDFVANNMIVPRDDEGSRISGAAVAEFTSDGHGHAKNIRILESPDPSAAKEAKRLIQKAPEWPNCMTIRVIVEF